MWVTKLLISPVKKRIFCPKTTKFGPKLAFLVNLGQAMQAYSVPCWLVGWWLWRAGCISQDTYLLYDIMIEKISCLNTTGNGVPFFRPAYLFHTENVQVDILLKFLYIKCFTTNPQTYRSKIPNVTNIVTIQRRQTHQPKHQVH